MWQITNIVALIAIMKDKRFLVIWFRIWFMLFSEISFVYYVNKCMTCFHTLSSEWIGTCGQEYEIKVSYHNKLPLVGFAEKKNTSFHCWIMYLTFLSRSLHYNILTTTIYKPYLHIDPQSSTSFFQTFGASHNTKVCKIFATLEANMFVLF